jgi:hypothetical protein
MIPLLKERLFVSLAQNAKHILHPHKKHHVSVQLDVSLKNARRVRRYREQRIEQEKAKQLHDALLAQVTKHRITKKESSRQIELLKAHLSLYKDRFETVSQKHYVYEEEKKKSDQFAILQAIEKELSGTVRQINILLKEKSISVDEEKELQVLIKKLKNNIAHKKSTLIQK